VHHGRLLDGDSRRPEQGGGIDARRALGGNDARQKTGDGCRGRDNDVGHTKSGAATSPTIATAHASRFPEGDLSLILSGGLRQVCRRVHVRLESL
jgi:hypothetical protein